jgi:predicted exporter
LATPQVDNLVIVKGDTEQQILERLTELKPLLVKLKTTGQLAGYDLATDLLPSDLQQRARQNAIPTKAQLTQLMQQASQGLPFKAHLFEPFINDLVATKSLPLLNVQSYQHTAWGIKLDNLISHRDDHWLAVVPLTGVTQQVTQVFANYHQPDVYYLNLKVATNELLTAYRHKALVLFSLGALVIGLLMLILLHNVTVWLRVVIPPFASVATTLAILVVSQQPLTLFHLIALLLVVGLGLDYSLFFNRQGDSAAGRRRTFAAIILCGLSTLVVFGLLSFSTLPVLKAIGNTVAIGVVLNVIFAWLSRSTNTCHNRS